MQPGSLPLSCIVSSAMVRFFWCMSRHNPITEEQTVIRTECATCTVLFILRRVQSKRQRYERCRGRVAIGGHMALVTTHARVLWGLAHLLSHVRHSARPSLADPGTTGERLGNDCQVPEVYTRPIARSKGHEMPMSIEGHPWECALIPCSWLEHLERS